MNTCDYEMILLQ